MLDAGKLTLRAATPADALCIGALGTQVFLDTYATSGIRRALAAEATAAFSNSAVRALLEKPGVRVAIAEYEDHMIGFVQILSGSRHTLLDSLSPVEIERLYVQEPFTRQGVGALLLRHAEGLARAASATDVWLTSWVHNSRARRFYARQGYADVGESYVEIEGERYQNRVFVKRFS